MPRDIPRNEWPGASPMTPIPDTEERHRPETLDDVPTGWCECGKPYPHVAAAPQPAEPGLRARIEALHPDGQPCVCVAAVLDMLDEVGPVGGSHWDSNGAALARDAEPVGLDVETLAEAIAAVDLAERDLHLPVDALRLIATMQLYQAAAIAAEYARLRESAGE